MIGRVGYVLRYYPTRSETFVAREIEELRARNVGVDVVAIGRRRDAEGRPDDAVRPPRWPVRGLVAALGAREGRRAWAWLCRWMPLRKAARAAWVATVGAERGWQRVHAHFAGEAAEWALAAGRILGVPYGVTVHAVDLFVPRRTLPELLAEARPVVTVCDHHAAWIAREYGVRPVIVRCGVPIEVPRADPGAEGARFVTVARDVPKKGLDALVDAVLATDGARLRLVSDAHRLGGPRILPGPVDPEAVPAVLARAHAFALACRIAADGDRDGVPVAILEAMAAGLPVVATAVSGIPEVVDDEVGWLVAPDDSAALRSALREACRPELRRTRGARARERLIARGYTVSAQVDALCAAWLAAAGPPTR